MRCDAFLFNGEWEVLTLRLATLAPVIDRFVLVESDRTFRGTPKPLHYAAHGNRLGAWRDRITYVPLTSEPLGLDAYFARETWQRAQIARGLQELPDDAEVWIGDVDEIPDPAIPLPRMHTSRQTLYYYDARTVCTSRRWLGTVAATVADVRQHSADGIRRLRADIPTVDGGWHFSHTGGVDAVHAKLRAGSHSEHDTPEAHATVADRMSTGTDLFDRDAFTWQRGALGDDLPYPLRDTPQHWPGLTEGRWT